MKKIFRFFRELWEGLARLGAALMLGEWMREHDVPPFYDEDDNAPPREDR